MTLPTPLSILLQEMHRKWTDGDREGAVELARLAAPYLHARVPPSKPAGELSRLSDAELDRLFGQGGEEPPEQGPA